MAHNWLGPRHADGAVVAPQQSTWERLWRLFTGKTTQEQLQKAAGNGPSPPPQPQEDISYVRKAAEEAGKRNEAAKNAQNPTPRACGGVVKGYGNYR